jgi:hypothetical protein
MKKIIKDTKLKVDMTIEDKAKAEVEEAAEEAVVVVEHVVDKEEEEVEAKVTEAEEDEYLPGATLIPAISRATGVKITVGSLAPVRQSLP